MPQFIAVTGRGLQEPLAEELAQFGVKNIDKVSGGVSFETNWEGCYRVNLKTRLATRILKPVLEFTAYDGEELYGQLQKHDFTKYFELNQTFKVEASVLDSKIHDQRFLAMKVKDAIVDQFRDKNEGVRPDVETRDPDFQVFVRGYKNKFQVSIDTSGDALFMRGYRQRGGLAPLKENLAAGLVALSGWDMKTPIVDPMCGSGTILIEAALMALNVAPGSLRRGFAFEKLKGFDQEAYDRVIDEVAEGEVQDLPFKLYGFDADRKVLQDAKMNARRAGVDHLIEFSPGSISTVVPPTVTPGVIITNPPYGTRLGDEDNLKDVYRDMGHTLKHKFQGWSAWILAGNKDLILEMKLKSSRKHTVFNGGLECRFLRYDMFAGSIDSRSFKKA